MPLMSSHHSVDVSVGPIDKILKNGNCVGMLQYLFIESSKRKKKCLTHAIQRYAQCIAHAHAHAPLKRKTMTSYTYQVAGKDLFSVVAIVVAVINEV